MSAYSDKIRHDFGESDAKRDAGLKIPGDVFRYTNFHYGGEEQQVLDVYRPRSAKDITSIPVIVSVHGGGWMYGDKDLYQYYCMSLCRFGFAVVNFSYRLAPEHKFPAMLEDTNLVFRWLEDHAGQLGINMSHVFALGDSAGANILGLYANLLTNPEYADLLMEAYPNADLECPANLKLSAICLNNGCYEMNGRSDEGLQLIAQDLFENKGTPAELEQVNVLKFANSHFPKSLIMTCTGDFLKAEAPKMDARLNELDVPHESVFYGDEDHILGHVFHLNMKSEDAFECNRRECAFFQQELAEGGGIIHRTATSREMEKCIKAVKRMTGKMGFDENMKEMDWEKVRTINKIGSAFQAKERGITVRRRKIGKLDALICVPEKPVSQDLIMYIHGGGFVSGSAMQSRPYCTMLAVATGLRVVSVEYRLAPEHPYPAGLKDCQRMYTMLKMICKGKVALVGDSAGANLCLALTLKLKDEKAELPPAVVLHSPLVDFSNRLDRTKVQADDFTVKLKGLQPMKELYAGNEDARNPEISPIYGNYKDFPPMMITCDAKETLTEDSFALYRKAVRYDVPVKMIVMENAYHTFATLGNRTPETRQILEETASMIIDAMAK